MKYVYQKYEKQKHFRIKIKTEAAVKAKGQH